MSTAYREAQEPERKSHLSDVVPSRSDQMSARVRIIGGQAQNQQREFQLLIIGPQFRAPTTRFTEREQQVLLQTIYDLSHAGNFGPMYSHSTLQNVCSFTS